MAAKLRQRDRNAGMYFVSFLCHFISIFLAFSFVLTSSILLNSNHSLINLSYWMDEKTTTSKNWWKKKEENILFYFCVISIFHTVSIDQNVICFVPFYIMYVFFLTLHIKFAYSTYRIALRYLTLNRTLRNSKMNGTLSCFISHFHKHSNMSIFGKLSFYFLLFCASKNGANGLHFTPTIPIAHSQYTELYRMEEQWTSKSADWTPFEAV